MSKGYFLSAHRSPADPENGRRTLLRGGYSSGGDRPDHRRSGSGQDDALQPLPLQG